MQLGVMIEGQEGLNWDRWRDIARATEDSAWLAMASRLSFKRVISSE